MVNFFERETVQHASKPQDLGRIAELDSKHQLLQKDGSDLQVASFDLVRTLGKWFLDQKFNKVLPSTNQLPSIFFDSTGQSFLGKIIFGQSTENHFPVTIRAIATQNGIDLELSIIPIHYQALEVAQFSTHSDALLALAAAAATAPQFSFALEEGIQTTHCSTKKQSVTGIDQAHAAPLAAAFETFAAPQSKVLQAASAITGNKQITLREMTHFHGQDDKNSRQIIPSSQSKLAAGVPIQSLFRTQLPRHALSFTTITEPHSGKQILLSVKDSLAQLGIDIKDLPGVAIALGFTAQVVGQREKTIENIFDPKNIAVPLLHLLT